MTLYGEKKPTQRLIIDRNNGLHNTSAFSFSFPEEKKKNGKKSSMGYGAISRKVRRGPSEEQGQVSDIRRRRIRRRKHLVQPPTDRRADFAIGECAVAIR